MNSRISWYVFVAAATVTLSFWACTDGTSNQYGGNPAPGSDSYTVTMVYTSFSPSSLRIPKGTTVTWKNNDGVSHTSTSNTGIWDTGSIAPGGSSTTRFDTVGTFGYHCTIHPMMTGTITVQ